MTFPEFLPIMAYLAAAVGKALPAEAAEVYFDLLGDLSAEVLQDAVKRVALAHKWSSFPTVAELREAAVASIPGNSHPAPGEAWALAWRAVGRIDLDLPWTLERATEGLPKLVVEAMTGFGLASLCYGTEPVGVLRGQFMKVYEGLLAREQRLALLPASLGGRPALPPAAQKLIEHIGEVADGHDP